MQAYVKHMRFCQKWTWHMLAYASICQCVPFKVRRAPSCSGICWHMPMTPMALFVHAWHMLAYAYVRCCSGICWNMPAYANDASFRMALFVHALAYASICHCRMARAEPGRAHSGIYSHMLAYAKSTSDKNAYA